MNQPHDCISLTASERATFDQVVAGENARARAQRGEILDVRHLAHAVGFHPTMGVYVTAAVAQHLRRDTSGELDVVGSERRLASVLYRAYKAITDAVEESWIARFPWSGTPFVVHTCSVSAASAVVVVELGSEHPDSAPGTL